MRENGVEGDSAYRIINYGVEMTVGDFEMSPFICI